MNAFRFLGRRTEPSYDVCEDTLHVEADDWKLVEVQLRDRGHDGYVHKFEALKV